MSKLKDCCLNITDGEHNTVTKDFNTGYFLLANQNMINGSVLFSCEDRQISKSSFDKIYKRCKIENGDILISTVGALGKLAIVKNYRNDYVFQRSVGIIKPNKSVLDSDFLYYLLLCKESQKKLFNSSYGSMQKGIKLDTLKKFEFELPSLEEQRKKTKLLKSLDDKISINNQINSELESMAKIIYDYWFLQFEFPNEDGKPYKSSGGKMVWSKELKREIPEGWEVTNLYNENLFSIIDVGLKKFDKKIYLATANIDDGVFTKGNIVDYDSRESRANMQPKQYSVWFAKMKDSVKHLFIPKNSNWFTDKYILSTGLYGLQCNEISFAYVASYIGNKNFEIQKNLLAHGSTQKAISDDDLKKIKLIVPSIDILKKYAEKINPIFEMIFSNLKENQELASLRDFLLPLLMNGQVVIED